MTEPVALTPEQATADALAALKAAGIRGAKVFSEDVPAAHPADSGMRHIATVCTTVTVRRAAGKYPAFESILRLAGGVMCDDQAPRAVSVWRRRDPGCGLPGCACAPAAYCRGRGTVLHYLPADTEDGGKFACQPQGDATATTDPEDVTCEACRATPEYLDELEALRA